MKNNGDMSTHFPFPVFPSPWLLLENSGKRGFCNVEYC